MTIKSSVSSLISSSTSASSGSINEEYVNYSQVQLAPSFYSDLEKSETCDVDQLVAVFLDRCRATESPGDSSTPRTQSADGSNSSSPTPTVTRNPGSSTPVPEDTVDIHPVTRELLESCLQKVIPICNSPEMQRLIEEYKKCQTETSQYISFVELANYALASVKSLELPELRKASTSNVLFHVNHMQAIQGIKGTKRFPDIVLVPLASARRVHEAPLDSWEDCTKMMDTPRDKFDWPDVLVSAEMKWHFHDIDSQLPETYDTDSQDTIQPIPARADDINFASILSEASVSGASGSTTTSGGLISPSSTRSSSAQGSVASATEAQESDTGSSRGRKRRSDHADQGISKRSTSKKIKANNSDIHGTNEDILLAVLRLGINAAEMLRCSLGRRHAFGMIIVDSKVWIWRFDHQGAIQSTGIDFIKSLPRFLVFLLAIQRFDLADWGFDEELDPSIPLRHSSNTRFTPKPVEYEVDNKVGKLKVNITSDTEKHWHEVFSLRGKSTKVFKVTAPGQPPLMAKLYWPNHNRPHEVKIIEHACDNPDLLKHLPSVRGWRNIDSIGTRRIRNQLGIGSNSPRLPRRLVIIIFEELFPITKLSGDYLVLIWLQCVRTHYLLWEKGIRHLDLSLGNLMYRQEDSEDKTKYYGVLNDWDLGDNENNLAGPHEAVVQRYSHDLESFVWILIWVFLAVRGGEIDPIKSVDNPVKSVDKWQTSDPGDSVVQRSYFIKAAHKYQPHEEWQSQWLRINKMLYWFTFRHQTREQAQLRAGLVGKSEAPDQNEALRGNQNNDSDQDETSDERKELLRSLLETLKDQYVEPTPISPMIPGL